MTQRREGEEDADEDRGQRAGRFEARLRSTQTEHLSVSPSSSSASPMKPPTDYIRHAARLARKLQMDASMGGTPQPDAEFYKALSKAFDEIAAGLELISKPD
jgi:hypothetical protein